jgi:serine phosphatase RsbU (regulator of sigma subunit)
MAQELNKKSIDSLQKIVQEGKHDSLKVKAMRTWDNLIYMSDPEMDLRLNQKIDSICKINLSKNLTKKESRFFIRCRADAYNVFGIYAQQTGKLSKAIQNYQYYLYLSKKLKDDSYIASAWSNLGIIYQMQGNFSLSTEYFVKSLKLREKIGDKKGMATSNNNIAMAYKDKNQYSVALKYYLKSLKLVSQLNDEYSQSLVLNNLGTILQDLGDSASVKGDQKLAEKKYKESLSYYEKSLKISRKIEDVFGEATALHNLGSIYGDMNDEKKSKFYYEEALRIRETLNDQVGMSLSLHNLSLIQQRNENHTEAIKLASRAKKLADESEAMAESSYAAKVLYKSYKKTGRIKEALEMHEIYIEMRDSLENEANQKSVMQLQFKYEYEKQATEDSTKTAEEKKVSDALMAKRDAELLAEKNRKYLLYGGLTLVILFSIFMYNRFRITKKQKRIIEEQKKVVEIQKSEVEEAHHQLEEKNKEITDSINYAKRIQEAILPSRYSVSEYIKNGFIIYKPKDIVAGDFYWIEKYQNNLYIAAADCTGHGVPGAMVSVVCSNALSKTLLEEGITDVGKILDRTRELVIEKFSKSEEEVKDGMDISLYSLSYNDQNKNETESKMYWAGANNPLWLIRNGDLIEYKPNKQPIGKYSENKPFTTHEIELQKGDCIYIFTDGFSDQFGGEKGKKYKSAKFKELLLSIQNESMEKQKSLIDIEFEKWRGDLEQNDDVCVIGFSV